MKSWTGAAAVCINEHGECLMVRQGKPDEPKLWSIPSGGKEKDETYAECCIWEVWEETGYKVEVVQKLFEKIDVSFGIEAHVHYFEVKLVGGSATIHDPDGLIYEVAWKSAEEIKQLELSFPQDRELLLQWTTKRCI
ncbi:NUDIX hydrolase [Paenactinomyces guangxiensis]|uniref:NUDIX hydrolase n=1 Tax=Paenactinomyces guangxiensis TaxID=1490290 RepID=A0A7W2A7Q2_9BACL|nr:NUDIX hydrolase [Paenactinomyces guangxiensis]MBA4493023.1 NUDIX hydrolase [Paenactinomyces guangxiensis]MBH8590128.1 NUDIX hydrolase [Paenactinomyces guangxiensis]